MTCAGNPSNIRLGLHLLDRQVGSTREVYTYRAEWYLMPLDLSNAVVTFVMVNADTQQVAQAGGLGAGSAEGVATYQPLPGDVDTPGIYKCQFRAAYADGAIWWKSPWLQARIFPNVEPPIPDPPPDVPPPIPPPP